MLTVIKIFTQLGSQLSLRQLAPRLASFPGSCVGEEEREPGTHCSRMRQVPMVTCILLRYTGLDYGQFLIPPERPHCMVILPVGHIRAV